MMPSQLVLSLLFLSISSLAQAQLYKWVGSNGTLNYSDKPPSESAARIEQKSLSSSNSDVVLPYELAQAIKAMPVTLYSTDNCAACSDGRSFLMKNGVPFYEKTVSTNEDVNKLKQLSGSAQVPLLFIGKNKLSGFNSSEWRTSLTQAGYPASNLLPANYHFSVPQPLAPTVTAPVKVDNQASTPASQPVPARHPNGFQF